MSEDAEITRLQDAILDSFGMYAPTEKDGDDRRIEEIAIDADWVALAIHGMPAETRIDKLPMEQRIAVKQTVMDVRDAGALMVVDGRLRRYDVTFANRSPHQKINPYPPGLFMLTYKGCAEVLRRKKEAKK